LRVSASLMMLTHGVGKLRDPRSFVNLLEVAGLGGFSLPLAYLSTLAETLFPLLIILGVAVRLSALVVSAHMMVAAFIFHVLLKGDPFPVWEKAALYAVVFLYLAMVGGGRFSILGPNRG